MKKHRHLFSRHLHLYATRFTDIFLQICNPGKWCTYTIYEEKGYQEGDLSIIFILFVSLEDRKAYKVKC